MKRSSQHVITPIVKYGVQIDKNAKLIDLIGEVEQLSRLNSSKILVVEVGNNKIYRVYDDLNTNLNMIYRRTNELFFYEHISRIQDLPIQVKRQLPVRGELKKFKSLSEIKQGQILDAQDLYGKWYIGIVVDRDFDFDNQQFSVKVHFYEFPERWDEWYNNETIHKLAPFATQAEEPKEKAYSMPMTHRKVVLNEQTNMGEHQNLGFPFYTTIGSWYTWEEAYVEIISQASRYIKNMKIHGTMSQRSVKEENENISEDDLGEEKSSKLFKYDSSQFSKKMQDVDKKGKSISRGEDNKRGAFTVDHKIQKQPFSQNDLFTSQSPNKDVQENDIELIIDKQQMKALQNQPLIQAHGKSMTSRIKNQSQIQQSYNDTILQTLGDDLATKNRKGQGGFDGLSLQRLPFKVSILDGDTHLCVICLFKSKYLEPRGKEQTVVTCKGCDIYQSADKVKWVLGCFKRHEVCIEWEDPTLYKNPLISSDMTCLKLLQQEKEIISILSFISNKISLQILYFLRDQIWISPFSKFGFIHKERVNR